MSGNWPTTVPGVLPSGEPENRHHAVIIGNGFGGLFAAKAFRRAPSGSRWWTALTITCSNRCCIRWPQGFFPKDKSRPPCGDVFRNDYSIRFVVGEVQEINPDEHTIGVNEFGRHRTITYDSLIVAGWRRPGLLRSR